MTSLESASATEEAGSVPSQDSGASLPKQPRTAFLATARRNLSEKELAAPGVRRFLISEIERLDDQVSELRPFVERYYELRADKAAIDAKLKGSRLNDTLSAVCLSAGSAGIGAATKYLPLDVPTGLVLLSVAGLLVLAGIVAKVFK